MTKEQIKTTIAKMKATEDVKKELQRLCDENHPHALFCAYGLMKRQENGKC